jgi:hypothetical protein
VIPVAHSLDSFKEILLRLGGDQLEIARAEWPESTWPSGLESAKESNLEWRRGKIHPLNGNLRQPMLFLKDFECIL